MAEVDPYEKLANAIIAQAATDYRKKLRCHESTRAIENFFHSDWFVKLSGGSVDPDFILKRLRREVGIYDPN